jgi:hypothetical protein
MSFSKLTSAVFVAVAVAVSLTFGSAVQAATDEQKAAGRERVKAKWESMTPEEKAAAKEKAKTKWDSMTPEQQAAAKKRFAERHPRAAAKVADKQQAAASAPAK